MTGRPVLPQDVMDGYRRNRIIEAAWKVIAEDGPEAKIADLVIAGRVGRKAFYDLFEGKKECLEMAVTAAAEELERSAETAMDAGGSAGWVEGIVSWVEENEPAAKTLLIHGAAIHPKLRAELEWRLALALDAEPSVVQEAVAGGILGLATRALAGDSDSDLSALCDWALVSLGAREEVAV